MSEETIIAFVFDNADEMVNMETFARYELTSLEAKRDIAKMVHRQCLPFNNPESPAIAAMKMEQQCMAYMEHAVEFSKELDPKGTGLTSKKYALKGQNPYSAAYRKIYNAVLLGGDLEQLQTSNSCSEFVSKKNKENADAELKAKVEQEVRDSLVKQGIDPESEEGQKMMKQELQLILGTKEQQEADNPPAPKDWIADQAANYEAQLRRWVEDGGADKDVVLNLTAAHIGQVEAQANAAIQFLAAQAEGAAA
jgi:hypothetical protein